MRDPDGLGERVADVLAREHGDGWRDLIRTNGDAWLRIADERVGAGRRSVRRTARRAAACRRW